MTTIAVSTGLDSFANPEEIGPMWPFEGLEWLFVVLGAAFWLGWHFLQVRGESKELHTAAEMYDKIGVDRAMLHGGSALIATDDEWAEELRRRAAADEPAPPSPS